MMIRSYVILLVAASCMALSASGVFAQSSDTPKGDPTKGKQLWLADGCSYCHGTVGQGGRAAGVRIAARPIPFAAFRATVREPAGEMPPYVESVLSDQDVTDIYAYIQALPPPPDLKTIDVLK